jgi:hypothetical protein
MSTIVPCNPSPSTGWVPISQIALSSNWPQIDIGVRESGDLSLFAHLQLHWRVASFACRNIP